MTIAEAIIGTPVRYWATVGVDGKKYDVIKTKIASEPFEENGVMVVKVNNKRKPLPISNMEAMYQSADQLVQTLIQWCKEAEVKYADPKKNDTHLLVHGNEGVRILRIMEDGKVFLSAGVIGKPYLIGSPHELKLKING